MRFQRLEIALLVSLAACGGGDPVATMQSSVVTISIFDFYYSPTSRTVPVGTRVEWVNQGPSPHTTTSDVGAWDSGSLSPPTPGCGGTPPPPTTPPPNPYAMAAVGGAFSFTFNTAGVYGFHCSLHPPATNPAFVGTITVTE